MSDNRQEEIIEVYKQIVAEKKEVPTYTDFVLNEISRDIIRRNFGGIEKLHEYMRDEHSEYLQGFFSSVNDIFDEQRNAVNSNKKIFVITTAVADAEAHMGFLEAIDNYCDHRNAQTIIMPCESVTNSFEKRTAVFDTVFNDPKYLFVQEDTPLNENISLCSIQVSAKQIKPITGLSRLGNREGSYVFASPKQFLEYVPSGNSRGKNYSIMTPGACTLPKYYTESFVSKRLAYIAEHDHTIGAIIVEIQDDRTFHFRQIQAAEDGSFIDMGVEYNPDGSIVDAMPTNIVFGDLHGVKVDLVALRVFLNEFAKLNVKDVFLHDVFDGYSISHHIKTIEERSNRSEDGMASLERELKMTYDIIEEISHDLQASSIYIVKSNHDEFLTRYLAEGRYVTDPDNHYVSLKIAPSLFEDRDVLEAAFEVVGKPEQPNWVFLDREASVKIQDIECGSHGDLGLNGAKPSINSMEKIYGACIVGHNHSAAIQRGVFRVGTLSELQLGYNRGPSSWTQTCCLVYDGGQRQLVNYVNGRVRL